MPTINVPIKNFDDLSKVIYLKVKSKTYSKDFVPDTLRLLVPILDRSNISECLKMLKNIAVKSQDYETGAMLRDFDRTDDIREELLELFKKFANEKKS